MVLMIFHFDIDGVISYLKDGETYDKAIPVQKIVDIIDKLYEEGHTIIINTARGKISGMDVNELTKRQMADWGVKYHELLFSKPGADYYIDDKALTPEQFYKIFESKTKKINSISKNYVEKEEKIVCL